MTTPDTREPFPVTDPGLDAPDGAIVDGYARHGDTWHPTDLADGHEDDDTYEPPCGDPECRPNQMHCGRCGAHSGMYGHATVYCKIRGWTKFHQCCPGDCELDN